MYISRLLIEAREMLTMVMVTFVNVRRTPNALTPEIPADIPELRTDIDNKKK